MFTFRFSAAFFLTSLAVYGQAGNANFYSHAKERSFGASMAQAEQRGTTPLDKAAVSEYVQKIAARLSAQIPKSDFEYTFAVVQEDIGGPLHEPLALPGGYVFIPAPLFLAARNEDEFAAMLAHAMEHVAARDATRLATSNQLAQLTVLPIIFSGDPVRGMMQSQIARRYESEADLWVVDHMSEAGFDPQGLAAYLERIQPPDARGAVSDLPNLEVRLPAIRAEIQRVWPRAPSNGGSFAAVQDEVRKGLP